MTRHCVVLAAAIAALCLIGLTFALEIPLRYERYSEREEGFNPTGYCDLKKATAPPAGEWKLPSLKSRAPIYAMVTLGADERLLILDARSASASFYDCLYFDANGNRDLTDDPVIDGKLDTRYQPLRVRFPDIDTSITVAGTVLPYSFHPHTYQYSGVPLDRLTIQSMINQMGFYIRSNCCYRGEFNLDGQTYFVALGDGNCNGYFNDTCEVAEESFSPGRQEIYAAGDRIYLAINAAPDYADCEVCSDKVLLNGNLFDLAISTAEGKMTLTPSTEKRVPLKIPMSLEHVSLYTQDRKHSLAAYTLGDVIRIPQGEYRLLSYLAHRKDTKGDLWSLSASATTESPWVNVDGSPNAVLPLGEPYAPYVTVPEWSKQNFERGNAQVYPELYVEGAGKEFVTNLSRSSGASTDIALSTSYPDRPKEPTYKIIKQDGTIVAQGSFEYG